ncbi:MAG: hypothetical protein H6534_09065 [Chthonomonadaceae bacterium]|nr:hypothetical protein [Chthonomonadaceae bacterium]
MLWLLLLVNTGFGVVFSSVTAVRKVRVVGAREYDRQRLETILDALREVPCARVDRPAIETAVLAEGDVAKASLERNPFGRATLRVTYRRAVAELEGHPGMLLSTDGVLFAGRYVSAGLPKVRLPEVALEPNAALAGLWEPRRVAELCRRAAEFGPVQKAVLDVDSTGRLCLNMGSGAQIVFGSSEQLDEKFDEVHRILQTHPNLLEDGFGVNVTAPGKSVLTPPSNQRKP